VTDSSLSNADDGELARRVAQGDRPAAAELVDRYQAMVRRFLRRLSGREHLADDLAQETFVRVLRSAERFDPRYTMKTWLLTIARRLYMNHIRKNGRMTPVDDFEREVSRSRDPARQVADDDSRAVLRKQLDDAIATLTEPQRAAIVLFHQQELSVEQAAEVMAMPAGTVKSHLHRARAALRKQLSPTFEVTAP